MPLFLILLVFFLMAYGLAGWLQRRGQADRRKDVLAAALLALACIGYFWRVLFDGMYMPADGGDLVSFLLPSYRFAAETLRAGQWPLWNPHLYGGAPHVGDVQAGFLYPPNLLLFLLKPDFGVQALQSMSMAHLWWAGLGMYALLRSLRGHDAVGRTAALAGALAFAFSDFFWVHFGNLNLIAAASWLPWVMAAFLRALEADTHAAPSSRFPARRAFAWAVAAGMLLGGATLAGHIQATLFIGLTLVLGSLLWLITQPAASSRIRLAGRAALLVLVSALIGALLAAPVLLPALELARFTARAGWSYQDTVGYSLSPAQWIGLVIPGFFGRGPQLQWGLWPRVEAGYLGILPLVLAGLALLSRRTRLTWSFFGIAAAGFLLALGIYSLPHGWLSLLPGFDVLRAPARFVLLLDFGLAVLAGLGLQRLLSPINDGETWRAISRLSAALGWLSKMLAVIVLPLLFAVLLLAQDKDPVVYGRVGVAAIAVLLALALLWASWALIAARRAGWAAPRTVAALALALIFLDLTSTGAYNDISPQNPAESFVQPAISRFLQENADTQPFRIDTRTDIAGAWQPSTALLLGWQDVWGVDNPSVYAPYEHYWAGLGSRSTPLYDFLNVAYLVAGKEVTLDWNKFELAFDGDPDLNVYRNRTALPRAQIVHQAQVLRGEDATTQAWEATHAPGVDPAHQVVLEASNEQLPVTAPAAGDESVRWLEYSPNRLVLELTATAPGYLVLSEVWYPGWQAEIRTGDQNERQPVLRANTAFRALPIWQAGTQVITLRFVPLWWRVGWVLLLVGLLLSAVLLLRARQTAKQL
ncbi:MAG: hypothetical protein ABTQ73_00415 [Caldilineales bacterium]